MRSRKALSIRVIGILLTLILLMSACNVRTESDGAANETELYALNTKLDTLFAEIQIILNEGADFVYKGVTYTQDEGFAYAQTELSGTEDYYPFFDALRDAAVAQSTRIGELFLQEVDVCNRYARLLGYDNYFEYASEQYGYDESTPMILEAISTLYPRSTEFLCGSSYLRDGIDGMEFLDHEIFMQTVAAWYGEINSAYQKSIEELLQSERFTSDKTSFVLSGGYVQHYEDPFRLPDMHISYCDDAVFAVLAVHECGHYIHYTDDTGKYDEKELLSISETQSIGGVVLMNDKINGYFTEITNDSTGSFLTLYTLYHQLLLFANGTAEYLLLQDLFEHPENYTASSIAEKYLQILTNMGYDAGFSPDYQILSGVEWINNKNIFEYPLYDPAYSIAALNAIWLWYEQETNGDGLDLYAKLICTPIADMCYTDYCVSVGLPDFTNMEAHAGIDDFLADKLEALETMAFSEED